MEQEDLWYNILLQSHVDDLQSYCMTNTISNKICHNKHFWYDYAILHHISEQFFNLPQKPSDWIKLIKINNQVHLLLKVIVREFELELDNYIVIKNGEFDKISFSLLPFLGFDFDISFLGIHKSDNSITLNTFKNHIHYHKTTDLNEIKFLLITLMYHYPDLIIRDEGHYSFLLEPLKLQLNRYGTMLEWTSKYRSLKDRLNFITHMSMNSI